jgi:hypothetical protein
MAEPKSMHTEADPSEGAVLYDSDNLAPRVAHLLGRRIS